MIQFQTQSIHVTNLVKYKVFLNELNLVFSEVSVKLKYTIFYKIQFNVIRKMVTIVHSPQKICISVSMYFVKNFRLPTFHLVMDLYQCLISQLDSQ